MLSLLPTLVIAHNVEPHQDWLGCLELKIKPFETLKLAITAALSMTKTFHFHTRVGHLNASEKSHCWDEELKATPIQ